MQLSADEQKAIIAAHKNTDQVQANGIRLAGEKYFTLQANDRSIYGKKQVGIHVVCMRTSGSDW